MRSLIKPKDCWDTFRNSRRCIAIVDGKTAALVERASVVDLIEAVNRIILK